MQNEQFSNRWGIILASLGMAIGAGNLWRFPRLAGQYGGTFIILWIVFLLVWSIPILLAEFAIGKTYKQSVIGSMGKILGKKWVWIGFFITFCTLFITFYYSVVTSWGLRYLGFSMQEIYNQWTHQPTLSDNLVQNPDFLKQYWDKIANGSAWTIATQIAMILFAGSLLYRGVKDGLETANKVLIPSLFVLLFIIMAVSVSSPNGWKGLEYMFTIRLDLFLNPTVWIEALSQSAWSTGAGWGLVMTIASYSREKEDVTLNTFISCFGNNTASLVSGMAILPAVFALATTDQAAIASLQAGNQALTFIVIPQLFSQITGGAYLSFIFFLAFFMAAFSSFLPMIELFIKMLVDLNISRKKATLISLFFCILLGIPSAYSLDFFSNQDWVWGIGLILSGFFMLVAVIKFGIFPFKKAFIDIDTDFKLPDLYFVTCIIVNVFLAIVLIYWWMSQGYSQYPWFDKNGNWNVLDVYSNATILTQWTMLLVLGILLNGWLYKKFVRANAN